VRRPVPQTPEWAPILVHTKSALPAALEGACGYSEKPADSCQAIAPFPRFSFNAAGP